MSSVNIELDLINPFVASSFSVLTVVLGQTPTKGSLALKADSATCHQVNVALGVTGQVAGYVILGLSVQTSLKIASAMMGSPVKIFDQLAASAVAELGNMICGNALLNLSEAGHVCDLAPPTVIRGVNVEISTVAIPAIEVPLVLECGELSITIGLERKAAANRAA